MVNIMLYLLNITTTTLSLWACLHTVCIVLEAKQCLSTALQRCTAVHPFCYFEASCCCFFQLESPWGDFLSSAEFIFSTMLPNSFYLTYLWLNCLTSRRCRRRTMIRAISSWHEREWLLKKAQNIQKSQSHHRRTGSLFGNIVFSLSTVSYKLTTPFLPLTQY